MPVRVAEPEVASRPHLVLADVAHQRRLVVGGDPDPLDDVVGGEPALAPRPGAVPRPSLADLAPGGELCHPLGTRLGLRQAAQERGEQIARIGDDPEVGAHVLADLASDRRRRARSSRVGANVRRLAGDAVVVPASDPDQQVALLERLVGVHPAVHAGVAGAQPMRLVDVADAEQGVRDRDLGALRDLEQQVGRARDLDAVAAQDQRTLGGGDHLGQVVGLGHVAARRAAAARAAGARRAPGAGAMVSAWSTSFGKSSSTGPGPPAARDLERLGDGQRNLVGIHDHGRVLRDRQRDADDVGLLEGVLAEQRARDVAGDRHHRDRVHHRRGQAGDEVDRPRTADVAIATPTPRVARLNPSAACAPPCSWRTRMWRSGNSRRTS